MKEIQFKKYLFDILKILFISIFFFLLIDLILGKFIYKKFLRKDFMDTYQDIYIKNSYDHTLKKELFNLLVFQNHQKLRYYLLAQLQIQ